MSTELTLEDAHAMLDALELSPNDYREYKLRTDIEKLAIGLVILQKVMRGKSLRNIEAEMGIPRTTVGRYRDIALSSVQLPTVDAARQEELGRLEVIIEVLWPQVEAGDEKAIASYMKVSERRAKMLGLDKPIQIDQVVTEVTAQEMELKQLMAQAERDMILEEATIAEQAAIES